MPLATVKKVYALHLRNTSTNVWNVFNIRSIWQQRKHQGNRRDLARWVCLDVLFRIFNNKNSIQVHLKTSRFQFLSGGVHPLLPEALRHPQAVLAPSLSVSQTASSTPYWKCKEPQGNNLNTFIKTMSSWGNFPRYLPQMHFVIVKYVLFINVTIFNLRI